MPPSTVQVQRDKVRGWLLGVLREARMMGYKNVEDLTNDLRDVDEARIFLGLEAGLP